MVKGDVKKVMELVKMKGFGVMVMVKELAMVMVKRRCYGEERTGLEGFFYTEDIAGGWLLAVATSQW